MGNWGEVIAFAWIGCGIFSGALASAKNRSGCGWFLAGLALGPIALLVSFLLPAARGETESSPLNPGD